MGIGTSCGTAVEAVTHHRAGSSNPGSGTEPGGLAFTGASGIIAALLIGSALLILGGLLVYAARRRRVGRGPLALILGFGSLLAALSLIAGHSWAANASASRPACPVSSPSPGAGSNPGAATPTPTPTGTPAGTPTSPPSAAGGGTAPVLPDARIPLALIGVGLLSGTAVLVRRRAS